MFEKCVSVYVYSELFDSYADFSLVHFNLPFLRGDQSSRVHQAERMTGTQSAFVLIYILTLTALGAVLKLMQLLKVTQQKDHWLKQ